ncbi:hypothetical protein PpBr36_07707 [Pyricularia pennisetigena]|uniref:hypothetical protein n=1 Tax=Pyricularia pennisetigena TaxID=1578925 RepID=UPI00115272D2|nr:hypothetical protein PpBr36_07707 [Pyricularia pennisetigena]TLS25986.1 hypothetical protein PpBr36_07707 [Pyricularia pennisetigena]
MPSRGEPAALVSHIPRVDGSAIYSHAGYTVTASANGPIEAQRRDEDPYEALVDVIVRPAAGVGGTRERHLESLLQATLRQIILVKNFPRGLIQVVLQVKSSPENYYANTKLVQANLNLPIIPALLQAAVLALLSAAIPLRATATCTVVAVVAGTDGETESRLILDPSPREAEDARSVHALAFTSGDRLILAESEGHFTMQEWADVHAKALKICCGPVRDPRSNDMDMGDDNGTDVEGPNMRHFIRETMAAKVSADLHWKG